MKDFDVIKIAQGVTVVNAPADRFKTNEIMISLCTPLCEQNASVNAVLVKLLSHTAKKYPTTLEFNKKLALLYGATVSGSVSKLGENQNLSLAISSLDDRFSLDDTKISAEAFELLISLLFDANVDSNGDFFDADITREKNNLAEALAAEDNEKRIYALRQLEKNMFKNEPYSINRYGTTEQIYAVTNDALKSALKHLLSTAKIQITVVGNADIDSIVAIARDKFSTVNRKYSKPAPAVFVPVANKVNYVDERIKVKQGKLVLGFRVNLQSDFESNAKMRSFADVFGGGPYSLLFKNVRERLSLCYYCSAKYDRRKSAVIVQCGCDEENMEKAVAEILNQIDAIKNGSFADELQASRIGLADVINSVNDDSVTLLSWYANQLLDNEIMSPRNSVKLNNEVTFDEVKECASLLSLDTVYRLMAEGEGE